RLRLRGRRHRRGGGGDGARAGAPPRRLPRLLRGALPGAAHGARLRRGVPPGDRRQSPAERARAGGAQPGGAHRGGTPRRRRRGRRCGGGRGGDRFGAGLTNEDGRRMARKTRAVDDELVNLHDQFYIQATSSRTDDRTRVLKHGETFAVFDRFGDVQPVGLGEQGIYHQGTRFLSGLELRLGGRRPLLLSSTVKKENDLLTVDLANPDLKDEHGGIEMPRGTLHLFRTKFLWDGVCHERVRVSSFATEPIETDLAL